MSEPTAEETATGTEETEEPQKPTETVDFWKQKAREQEKRAKDNAAAAKRLTELEDAQKSDAERAADQIAKAEAEAASVPEKVAVYLRDYLAEFHEIEDDRKELYITGTTPELVIKQVAGLVSESGKRRNHVPREGQTPSVAAETSDMREFTRQLFGGE